MEDNLNIRGKIDRVFVSRTESWEVSYFVDRWLTTRDCGLTHENRRLVNEAVNSYQGRAPIMRDDLNAYLDRKFRKSAK